MNALKRLLSPRQQHSQEKSEIMNNMVTEAAMVMDFIDTSDEPQGRGSRRGKSPNHQRQRLSRGKNLMEDYFVDRPIFSEGDFRRSSLHSRFLLASKSRCGWIIGVATPTKMTVALRMLAYGAAADQCAEICRMGELTTLECMKKICEQVEGIFGKEYLRAPTPADLRRLLARGKQRGFLLGLNMYSTFVKTISNPATQAHKLFTKKQEAHHKDVEMCFGILQSRWAILRYGARMHKHSTLRSIMMTYIILHNMIVEDEFVEDGFVESVEEDLMNPLASRVFDRPVDCNGVRIPFAPVQRDGRNQQAFWDRIEILESAYVHTMLQNDLVEHNWALEANE
ncbi:uncharacterized protein LOC141690529 [Apium graveolens]|uniref:uncharacterized protein LOC141690529 n=1 Tax=Apium graveolens TaxID=4045 RepID=UPI003D7B6F36